MMKPELFPCHACGMLTDINLLDAKDDGTWNWVLLECKRCYGPGWVAGSDPVEDFKFVSGGDDD